MGPDRPSRVVRAGARPQQKPTAFRTQQVGRRRPSLLSYAPEPAIFPSVPTGSPIPVPEFRPVRARARARARSPPHEERNGAVMVSERAGPGKGAPDREGERARNGAGGGRAQIRGLRPREPDAVGKRRFATRQCREPMARERVRIIPGLGCVNKWPGRARQTRSLVVSSISLLTGFAALRVALCCSFDRCRARLACAAP